MCNLTGCELAKSVIGKVVKNVYWDIKGNRIITVFTNKTYMYVEGVAGEVEL